jgi:hypothetical protein
MLEHFDRAPGVPWERSRRRASPKDAFNDNVEHAVSGCLVGLRVEVCAFSSVFWFWSAEGLQTEMVCRNLSARRPFSKWRYADDWHLIHDFDRQSVIFARGYTAGGHSRLSPDQRGDKRDVSFVCALRNALTSRVSSGAVSSGLGPGTGGVMFLSCQNCSIKRTH